MRFVCTYMIDQETVRNLKVFICRSLCPLGYTKDNIYRYAFISLKKLIGAGSEGWTRGEIYSERKRSRGGGMEIENSCRKCNNFEVLFLHGMEIKEFLT